MDEKKQRRNVRAIPVPSIIDAEETSAGLKATWSAVTEAAIKVTEALPFAHDTDREAIRTVANTLSAIAATLGQGDDGDALGKLNAWSKAQREKATPPGPPIHRDRVNVEHRAGPEKVTVAPTCRELARRIRDHWQRLEEAVQDVIAILYGKPAPPLPEGMIRFVETEVTGEVTFLVGAAPGGEPATVGGPPGCLNEVVIDIGWKTRIDVARDLAQQLQALSESWFTPGREEELAEAIYEAMPLSHPENPGGRTTDKQGLARERYFRENHESAIKAAFRAAGCPPDTAHDLFKD